MEVGIFVPVIKSHLKIIRYLIEHEGLNNINPNFQKNYIYYESEIRSVSNLINN
jgi:thermostable 8-oxoguanine DNA glycosylase